MGFQSPKQDVCRVELKREMLVVQVRVLERYCTLDSPILPSPQRGYPTCLPSSQVEVHGRSSVSDPLPH